MKPTYHAQKTHNFSKKIKKWREANKRKNQNRRNSK